MSYSLEQCSEGRDSHRQTNRCSVRLPALRSYRSEASGIVADHSGRCGRSTGKKAPSEGWPGRPHNRPLVVEVQLSELVELETLGKGHARQGGLETGGGVGSVLDAQSIGG